jgi:HSP20 family protein
MVKKNVGKIEIKSKKDKIKNIEKTAVSAAWDPFNVMNNMEQLLWDDPWMPMWRRHRGPIVPRRFMGERWLEPGIKHTAVDIVDTGKEFKIVAEMPGIKKEDIAVSINPNNISICGETKVDLKRDEEGFIRRERGYSTLCRSMAFPEEVDPDKAEASLRDGILEIVVSKKNPHKGRNIPVK